jgi:hypothetical protein
MPLTYGQIISIASQSAHAPAATDVALQLLNAVQTDICTTYDFAEARGQFFFSFTPSTFTNAQFIGAQFGSGPYNMPMDYLRLSGSSGSTGSQRSFIWWLQGVPYPVIPCDLAEFDLQVQQAGLNSYVWLAATDMSAPVDDRVILTTTGTLNSATTVVTPVFSVNRLVGGNVMGVAGQGIQPGTTLTTLTTSSTNSITLSAPPLITLAGASLMFGYSPTIYVYPPPSSAQPAMIRYQRMMPPITDTTRYPWCHSDVYWIEKLTGYMCLFVDDDRAAKLLGGPDVPGSPDNKLKLFLAGKDDDASHPKTVELDRRRFGSSMRTLPNTKTIGW